MSTKDITAFDDAIPDKEALAYSKVVWRILPLLFLCFIVAYLDRVNVGFAKLQMSTDLNFSETVYGLGAGMFFVGYFFFEVPSNLILYRVGARKWIARIMITWGIISALMMFVTTPTSFYVMRFLLGVAEAGFTPGVLLYLTYWFPARRRGRAITMFMAGIPISGIIGSPLSGWILQTFNGVYGWAGWQWLFLLEGAPTVLVGLLVWKFLDNSISEAKWLTAEEKKILQDNIREDVGEKTSHSFKLALSDIRVWILALIYFCVLMGLYGVSFWLPTLIKATGVERPLDIGLLSAIPYIVSIIAMSLINRSSDKHAERRWHFAIPAIIGGVGLILSAVFVQSPVYSIIALTVGCAGIMTITPLFWTFPTAFLGGTAAAGGIAMINSLGNLSGFVSSYLIGFLRDLTHSTNTGMYMLGGFLFLCAILVMTAIPARLVNR
ncbi:MFS transporter [Pseudomonas sp. ES4]|uniref:MFS transporter n=1 Tax=Pseudomonas sp. ES4 TaxID=3424777 RepID=UPI003D331369